MVKIVGKQDNRVQAVHVCRCHFGRNATFCSLVSPVEFAAIKNVEKNNLRNLVFNYI